MVKHALLSLSNVSKIYQNGDREFKALDGIDISIQPGEMIAIVGASGSGKSTLMNIMGCLDQPTMGNYLVAGRETEKLESDELSHLRRKHFGFIFQSYHLLESLTVIENVQLPAVYAGENPKSRRIRASDILDKLGMLDRINYFPSQLSGGQQQRVSIARALMNGGDVILADEPTGALDSANAEKVMTTLKELNQEGHTIVLVTHDEAVASQASRIINLSDGKIASERDGCIKSPSLTPQKVKLSIQQPERSGKLHGFYQRLKCGATIAFKALRTHRLRTFLAILGVMIGVASVVSLVAFGVGAQSVVIEEINSLGTNTINVYNENTSDGSFDSETYQLSMSDVKVLAALPHIDSIAPVISAGVTARYGRVSVNSRVVGVGGSYFLVNGLKLAAGRYFNVGTANNIDQVALINETFAKVVFRKDESALGKIVLLDRLPVRIIGVLEKNSRFDMGAELKIFVPFNTLKSRMRGYVPIDQLTIRASETVSSNLAKKTIREVLTQRIPGAKFFIESDDSIRKSIFDSTTALNRLIISIAIVSLVAAGIGVMNIMLVSVGERIHEIGLRMSMGARRSDILMQFLFEAVLVCLIGGMIGVKISFLFSLISDLNMTISKLIIFLAFLSCLVIGITFGFLPARQASRLNPVESLP